MTKFGGFYSAGGELVRSTITDAYFTESQFREWYGTGKDGWISPGESVVDPNNYGAPCVWVYFLETDDGEQLRIGGEID